MASEMLSKVLDAENSDKEAQKAAHEQAQKTVDAAVEAGEGAVARKKAEAAKKAEEIIAVPNLDVAACAGDDHVLFQLGVGPQRGGDKQSPLAIHLVIIHRGRQQLSHAVVGFLIVFIYFFKFFVNGVPLGEGIQLDAAALAAHHGDGLALSLIHISEPTRP